jgi:hypothetical protein
MGEDGVTRKIGGGSLDAERIDSSKSERSTS